MQAVFGSIFYPEMEAGNKASLGDYLYIKGRIGWKGLKKDEYLNESGYRIINGESLTATGIDWNKAGYISEERYMESPEIMLKEGDILISKDGTIGKVGYVNRLDKPTSVASGIFVVRNLKPEDVSTVFIYCLLNTRKTIKGWDYFVKWSKVLENISKVELKLNILNYLIGKKDIEEATRKVLREYPEVFQVIPCLVAMREDNIRLLEENEEKIFNFSKKEKLSEKEIDEGVEFLSKSGILKLLKTEKIKNLVDYTLGVEVGLDSNGRKNRTGNAMENLIEVYVAKICKKYGYEYISQATAKAIKEK